MDYLGTIRRRVVQLCLLVCVLVSNGFSEPLVGASQRLLLPLPEGTYRQAQGFKGTGYPQLFHLGKDYCVKHAAAKGNSLEGTPFYAVGSGTVIDFRYTEPAYRKDGVGNYIVVDHHDGVVAVYMHLARIYVKKGDPVTADTILGEAGDVVLHPSPNCPHLHIEVRKTGVTSLNVLPNLRYGYVSRDGKTKMTRPVASERGVLAWIDTEFFDPDKLLEPRGAKLGFLSLDAFKARLNEIQGKIDMERQPGEAVREFQAMRGRLEASQENRPYIVGVEVSLLWAVNAVGVESEVREKVASLLARPNEFFIGVEKYQIYQGIIINFWRTGFTHPEAMRVMNQWDIRRLAPIEKLTLLTDYAARFQDMAWGRLNSGDGKNYGENELEEILYKLDMDPELKLKAFYDLRPLLSKLRFSS